MFFHLLYIHLFRPFLKYNPITSPLPSHVSPRKLCTHAAGSVSKLMRLYKRTYGLRQICNIAVYIVHSACTIHLLSLPEKTAKRDIIHGVKHLEEIAEDWLCARRTLSILSVLARKWRIELPEEASLVFARTDAKFGTFSTADVPSPKTDLVVATPPPAVTSPPRALTQNQQHAQRQNQLKQSLYSYLPGPQPTPMNGQISIAPRQSSQFQIQHPINPVQNLNRDPSSGVGSVALPNESLLSSLPHTRYNTSGVTSRSNFTPTNDMSRSDSVVMSEPTSTRQVSPSTIFGGVDALVESQDWWLRDQASLAMGFDNWMSGDPNGGNLMNGNGNGNIGDFDPMTGMTSGFYMLPNNANRGGSEGNVEDDWNTYT
jgi:hypothetical protein